MRRVAKLIGIGLFAASTGCGSSSSPTVVASPESSAAGISVTGRGEASGTPDLLLADIGVSVLRPNVGEAISEATRRTDAILAATRTFGIRREDLQTTSYSVGPEYQEPVPGGKEPHVRRLAGYRVTHVLTIKIRDLARAGAVLDAGAAAAGNEAAVGSLRLAIENDRPLQDRARNDAWKDARAKAEQLARLSGVRLAMPITVSESGATAPPVPVAEARAMTLSAPTPIEPGQLKVSVVVGVRFAIY
jgi:uncharacterized protein